MPSSPWSPDDRPPPIPRTLNPTRVLVLVGPRHDSDPAQSDPISAELISADPMSADPAGLATAQPGPRDRRGPGRSGVFTTQKKTHPPHPTPPTPPPHTATK